MKRGKTGTEFSKYLTPKVAALFLRALVQCLGLLSIPVIDGKRSPHSTAQREVLYRGRNGQVKQVQKAKMTCPNEFVFEPREELRFPVSLRVVFAKPAIPKHGHQGLCVQPLCKNSLFITLLCVWQL